MTWNGWAVTLNGVTLVCCEATQADWDALDCFPTEVIDGLDLPIDGIGDLPEERTEDQSYYQRDGVKHFSDYYGPRIITVIGTVGPYDDECQNCSDIRQQVRDLIQAWKLTCCDTELVVWPDCYSPDLATGLNVYPSGSFDTTTDGWTGEGASVARVTAPVQSGAGSLEVQWGTDAAGDEQAAGPVYLGTPGDRYRVGAWLYANVGEPRMIFGVADSAGVGPVLSDPITADGSWYYLEVDYLVPANGEVVPFVVSADPTGSGDLGYVDDVEMMLYNSSVNRDLNGPFGIVGRPRAFQGNWQPTSRDQKIYKFTARFEAVDQRMYVLDQCGTPGYNSCETIQPGVQILSACWEENPDYPGTTPSGNPIKVLCWGEEGVCWDNEVDTPESVEPVGISVGGTEKVNPTVTFYPPLVKPTIENVTTGEFIQLDTTLLDADVPVTINTEEGTAFDSNGNSLTDLLRGSLFLSMYPGNYQWRLISNGAEDFADPGYSTVCWRNTVVNA